MSRFWLGITVLALMTASAGCETVKGVGRDITNTGSAVQGMMSGGEKKQDRGFFKSDQ